MVEISIVVPVYNADEHLANCLDSIINQTFTNIEIILVNDGSSDKSQSIIDQYCTYDDRVKSIYQDNSGPGEARNAGLKLANGKYIGFVDSDDTVQENMFEIMYKKAVSKNCDLVSCNYRNDYGNGKYSETVYDIDKSEVNISAYGLGQFIKTDVFQNRFGSEVWSKLIRKDIIQENNILFRRYREVMGEDILFLLECLLEVESIIYVDEALYNHKIREGSLAYSYRPKMMPKFKKLIDIFIKVAKNKGKYEEVKEGLPYMVYSLLAQSLVNEKTIKEKRKLLKQCSEDELVIESMQKIRSSRDAGFKKKLVSQLLLGKHFNLLLWMRKIKQSIGMK